MEFSKRLTPLQRLFFPACLKKGESIELMNLVGESFDRNVENDEGEFSSLVRKVKSKLSKVDQVFQEFGLNIAEVSGAADRHLRPTAYIKKKFGKE